MALKQIVAPEQELLAVGEVKNSLLLTHCADDPLLTALLTTAREMVEAQCERQFVTATWQLTLDKFPCGEGYPWREWGVIELERPPIQADSVVITYVDANGDTQTLDEADYQVDVASEPGRIKPAFGLSWPTTRCQMNAVTVTFDAGYGEPTDVPDRAKQLVQLLVSHWYQNREPVGNIGAEIPLAYQTLLNSLKWH